MIKKTEQAISGALEYFEVLIANRPTTTPQARDVSEAILNLSMALCNLKDANKDTWSIPKSLEDNVVE